MYTHWSTFEEVASFVERDFSQSTYFTTLSFSELFNESTSFGDIAVIGGFNKLLCLPVIQLLSNSSFANDPRIFYHNQSHIFSDYNAPIIKVDTCNMLCGGGSIINVYPDVASRLLTWFIPCIFLITSLRFAPIGSIRFVMLAHLFGNPVHTIWSLLSKLEDWNHCYAQAQDLCRIPYLGNSIPEQSNEELILGDKINPRLIWRILSSVRRFFRPISNTSVTERERDIAVIIAGIKELTRSPEYTLSIQHIGGCICFEYELDHMRRNFAGEIVDKRASGTLRAWFAIATYIFGIAASFITALGGSLSPSGGKLAPPMLLSWLLPVILLSNNIGQFLPEDCIRIVTRFEQYTRELQGPHLQKCVQLPLPLHREDWTRNTADLAWSRYLGEQAWSGGIYSCQFQKKMLEDGPRRHKSILLIVLSILPVIVSYAIAFGLLYSAPTFFSCRHFMIIGILVAWLLSPVVTRIFVTMERFKGDEKTPWIIILFKDSIIGFAVLFLLIASSCGLFNSCRCWAGYGNKMEAVQLNSGAQFLKNIKFVYPLILGSCLIAQYLNFKLMLCVGRIGLRIMRWSGAERVESLPARAGPTVREQT